MVLFYLFVCFTLVQTCLTEGDDNYSLYKDHKMYHIHGAKEGLEQLVDFLLKNHEIRYHSKTEKECHMLVSPALVPIVENVAKFAGLNTKVIHDDYSEIIRNEKASRQYKDRFSWTAYYDVDDIYDYLKNMSREYIRSAQLVVGGRSYEGRQILGLRINTQIYEDKKVMVIESGIHAREWIAPATTTYLINQLLTNTDPEIESLRDQFDWYIFPTVNPDGYHYSYTKDRMWRKTRSPSGNGCYGTDPNRNWDYNWMKSGSTNYPCDDVYAGSAPFSEIETKTFSEYISGLKNLVGYIGYHSYAQQLLMPYSDSTKHFDNYDDLKKIGETSIRYGYAVNKEMYGGPGTAAEILYPVSGGSMDWVRHTLGTPLVFTYELRGNGFVWPPSRINEQGEEVIQMMVGLVKEARNLGYL